MASDVGTYQIHVRSVLQKVSDDGKWFSHGLKRLWTQIFIISVAPMIAAHLVRLRAKIFDFSTGVLHFSVPIVLSVRREHGAHVVHVGIDIRLRDLVDCCSELGHGECLCFRAHCCRALTKLITYLY